MKQWDMAKKYEGDPRLRFFIGDVRDGSRLRRAMEGADFVVHAAAMKQVPACEYNPLEAVKTNVHGAINVIDAALDAKVTKVIALSTDKAVNPTNVMGASKRLAELYCQVSDLNQDSTRFITVRFGNVLGSAGSVVPLFKKQISSGGPLTVTHENIERYFMTVGEAVELVLQAAALAPNRKEQGAVYVLDMGSPIKITQLASDLIRLSGLSNDDIPIVFTGLRPGEKLSEKLFYDFEKPLTTEHNKIQCCFPDISGDVLTAVNTILKSAQESTPNNTLINELLDSVNELNSTINLISKGAT